MNHPLPFSITEALALFKSGELTSVDLTKLYLKRLKRYDRKLNSCLLICEKQALAAAKMADLKIANGEEGALLGIPFLVKDNIMTKGLVTTAASKLLKNYISPYDATIIKRLKAAGAVLLGKTNLDEFAHGSSTENSAFGSTKNPHDLTRVPGGSSGGSATAVAAGFCLFALGTDTGGSVRQPASLCGTVGYKPTYGLCSRFGLIAMTSSTDVPGILANTATDAALVLSIMAGQDEKDPTTFKSSLKFNFLNKSFDKTNKSKLNKTSKVNPGKNFWSGKTIGVVKEFSVDNKSVHKAFEQSLAKLKEAGAKLKIIKLPSLDYAVAAYYVITPSEVSSNLARFDGLRYAGQGLTSGKKLEDAYGELRAKGFGPEVKRRIMLGTFALSSGYYDAYYNRACRAVEMIKKDFRQALSDCDIIITPSTPSPAFKLGSKTKPLDLYREDAFVIPASLAGLPAISVPVVYEPLPIGLQLIGQKGQDDKLLEAADEFMKLNGLKIKLADLN